MRISIIGLPGSGKTTVAKLVSEKLNLPHITEKFDNNPFLDDPFAPQELVTLIQIHNLKQQQKENVHGVFEVTTEGLLNIFLTNANKYYLEKTLQVLNYPLDDFFLTFYLYASLDQLESRIKQRERKDSLKQMELISLKSRFERVELMLKKAKNLTSYSPLSYVNTDLLNPEQCSQVITEVVTSKNLKFP